MVDPLLKWREQFPITARSNYMISNSLGAMPRSARESVQRYLDLWDVRGVRAWPDEWWSMKDEVSGLLEGILGVEQGSVSMHVNVATASETVLSCFTFDGPRNKVVFSDLNFPSVMYLYEAQRAVGAEIVRVPATDDGVSVDLQRLLDAIDERTLLVPVSHALFRSSFIQDASAIAARAREVGAFTVLDVFQSVGTVPLELKKWGVHAAVGGALKYLCGGPGNCFLYVDPDERRKLEPRFTGWSAHQKPFDFSSEGQVYREDGGRFMNGTPNIPGFYAGRDGIRIVSEIGVEAIREKSQRLSGVLIDRAQKLGFGIGSPLDPAIRGGHVTVVVPHAWEVCQALLAEDILVDYRPGAGIRMAPHFYNTEREVIDAVERTAEILESGAYQRFVGQERGAG
jgi:kynureninase